MSWVSDDMPETTPAVVMVSECGYVVKRLPFVKWCTANNSYSYMKEMTYSQSSDRGKQRKEIFNESKGKYLSSMINGRSRSVHRLVALAWIKNKNNKPQVNHIDGNRSNNHYLNLEWVTNSENMAHAIKMGLTDGSVSLKSHVSTKGKEMLALRLDGKNIEEIGHIFGVSHETVRKYSCLVATNEEILFLKKQRYVKLWQKRKGSVANV